MLLFKATWFLLIRICEKINSNFIWLPVSTMILMLLTFSLLLELLIYRSGTQVNESFLFRECPVVNYYVTIMSIIIYIKFHILFIFTILFTKMLFFTYACISQLCADRLVSQYLCVSQLDLPLSLLSTALLVLLFTQRNFLRNSLLLLNGSSQPSQPSRFNEVSYGSLIILLSHRRSV